jgi:hypothetical protein
VLGVKALAPIILDSRTAYDLQMLYRVRDCEQQPKFFTFAPMGGCKNARLGKKA